MQCDAERAKRLLPQQIAACIAVAASAAAVIVTADSPGFGTFVGVAIAAGCVTSAGLTYLGVHAEGLWMPVAALAIACAALRHTGLRLCELFYPLEVSQDPDLLLAMAIAWIGVARCFGLTRPRSASFSLIPGLAPFGLVGALNLSPGIIVGFFVFLFAAVFVLGYERLLQEEDRVRRAGSAGISARSRTHSQLVATSVLLIATIGIAAVGGTVLHRVMPTLATALANTMASQLPEPSSLAMISTASSDDFDIGQGPIELRHLPLMWIAASEPRLWRTAVYDEYTGNSWRRSRRGGRPVPLPNRTLELLERDLVTVEGPQRIIKQTVYALAALPPELSAAAQPVRIQLHRRGYTSGSVIVDDYGCLRALWRQQRQTAFTVWSAVSTAASADLRAASDEYPEQLREMYLELPLRTRLDAQGIADRIAGDAATPYDKAIAIAEYLRENQAYTLDGPYIPYHRDAVMEFLTRHRRGACDLFASGFVVLARAQGIPARIAVGYNTGAYDPEKRAYLVHEDQAHAWAEVYFPGYGWTAFDPSEGATLARPSIWSLLKIGQYWGFILAVLKRVLAVGAALGFLTWLVSAAFNVPVLAELLRRTRGARARDPRTRLLATYEHACGLLRRAGLARRPWQTPAEYATAVAARCPAGSPPLVAAFDALTHALERVRYGRSQASPDDVASARQCATRIAQALRELRRAARRRRPLDIRPTAAGGDAA